MTVTDLPSVPATTPLVQRVKRYVIKTTVGLILLIGIAVAAWFWLSLNFVYSSGERAGYLQKFSKKGWVIKTWEGELSMINIPGAAPEKFYFTVRSDDVAKRMTDSIGQRVSVSYNEHRALPGRFFGDTNYFVTNVKVVPLNEAATPPTAQ